MVKKERNSTFELSNKSMVAYRSEINDGTELPLFLTKREGGTVNPSGPYGKKPELIRSASHKNTMQGPSSQGYGWGSKARNMTGQSDKNINASKGCRPLYLLIFCILALGISVETIACLVLSFRIVKSGMLTDLQGVRVSPDDLPDGISAEAVWYVGAFLYLGVYPGIPFAAFLLTKMSHSVEKDGVLHQVTKLSCSSILVVCLGCLASIALGIVLLLFKDYVWATRTLGYSCVVFITFCLLLAVAIPAGMYLMGYNQEKADENDEYMFGPSTPTVEEQSNSESASARRPRGGNRPSSSGSGVHADGSMDEEELRENVEHRIEQLKQKHERRNMQVDAM